MIKQMNIFLACCFSFSSLNIKAQVTEADYTRADSLSKRNEKIYNSAVRPN